MSTTENKLKELPHSERKWVEVLVEGLEDYNLEEVELTDALHEITTNQVTYKKDAVEIIGDLNYTANDVDYPITVKSVYDLAILQLEGLKIEYNSLIKSIIDEKQ